MRDKTVTTKAGDFEYPITVRQFESLDEARDVWAAKGENPDDVLLGILNAAQEQNGKQGGKNIVRKAQHKGHDTDSPEFAEAITSAQKYAAGYVIGSPRGGTLRSGQTKTQAKEWGVNVQQNASPEQLAEIMEMLGL